ncbi:hypothetical protein H5410_003244 [Solanum commersonii]|uniref:DUF4283 domain-containing protein n=1 Tax=Solanum commersonii TaxID=4109 RepID=A0A9J6B541_SOLCO|nr:hypothetical protein H5410_003244 [Solanum commersonii]
MIRVNLIGNHDSPSHDLSSVQKSSDCTLQIDRSNNAILGGIACESPGTRVQIRPPSEEMNEFSTTGESSLGQGVHLTEISNHFHGGITGSRDKGPHQTIPLDEANPSKVSEFTKKHQNDMCIAINLQDKEATNADDHQDKLRPQSSMNNSQGKKENSTPSRSITIKWLNNLPKRLIQEPAPYTVVQTYAAGLRFNQAKTNLTIVFDTPKISTKQGLPATIFKEENFMVNWADRCKYTLIGKFSNTMPKVELIRKSFITQTQLSGGVKIAHYNARHVYIDLDNDLDYITVWTKQRMTIEGQPMRIQTWTPTFKPEEETPIVPIWIALPALPWHCYNKKIVSAILSPIGKVLYLDSASVQKTRGSLAKVRIQMNLTKERPPHVWMGFNEEDLTKGRWQAIEYESVPNYCGYCKHQGHMIQICTIKQRDEDYQKRKEMEAEKKNKPRSDQEKKENFTSQPNGKLNQTATTSNEIIQTHQEKEAKDQEQQWQTQKRKQNKNQEHSIPKTVWRPVSPQHKGTNDNMQQAPPQSVLLTTIPTHNNYTDLDMQEQSDKGKAEMDNNNKAADQGVQAVQGSENDSSLLNIHNKINKQKEQVTATKSNKITGIDSVLPLPHHPNVIYVNVEIADEVSGGMNGRCKEKPTI